MYLFERLWTCLVYSISFITLPPLNDNGIGQVPLIPSSSEYTEKPRRGPIFKPPGGSLMGPDANFTCDYSAMAGFVECSTPGNRGCWLRNPNTGFEYNITTDYEDLKLTPVGIHRTYYLNITDQTVNADGMDFDEGKIFNNTYPGPWIQGCWGDVRTLGFPRCAVLTGHRPSL